MVEDDAVLPDFDKGGALVSRGNRQRRFHVLRTDIHGAGHESGAGTKSQLDRIERRIHRTERRSLGLQALR